jgi:hypothetical protein
LKKRLGLVLLGAVLVVAAIYVGNLVYVGHPVRSALETDVRNGGVSLSAHLEYWLLPNRLVLDLREIQGDKAALDLWRVLLQAAGALEAWDRHFEAVLLVRAGDPVFLMSGSDFTMLGSEHRAGQNPVYLLRTLPEKLRRPDGSAAFDSWTGGFLGVAMKQMEDLNSAALSWITGDTD